jgi:hypothetical protein
MLLQARFRLVRASGGPHLVSSQHSPAVQDGSPVRPKPLGAWHGFTACAVTTVCLLSTRQHIGLHCWRRSSDPERGGSGHGSYFVRDGTSSRASGRTVPFARSQSIGVTGTSIRDASGGNDPGALRNAAVSHRAGLGHGRRKAADEVRERAAQASAKAQNIPIDQARSRVGQYEQQHRQMVDKAKRQATVAAEAVAKTASRGALFCALALILGGLTGWFGVRMGAVHPTVTAGPTSRLRGGALTGARSDMHRTKASKPSLAWTLIAPREPKANVRRCQIKERASWMTIRSARRHAGTNSDKDADD